MTKLHQVIAVEKGVKSRVYEFLTKANKAIQKDTLFKGFIKKYEKNAEDGEDFPDEKVLVQLTVNEVLDQVQEGLSEYIGLVLAKDDANCRAKANISVNGQIILENVPATYLLFLEKQLTDLYTMIGNLPVLDPAYSWDLDMGSGLFKSDPKTTSKTKRVAKPVVKYPATKEHPAQTEMVTLDEIIGSWVTINHSGAITKGRKKELEKKVLELLKAVKYAREEANTAEITRGKEAKAILDYLFA